MSHVNNGFLHHNKYAPRINYQDILPNPNDMVQILPREFCEWYRGLCLFFPYYDPFHLFNKKFKMIEIIDYMRWGTGPFRAFIDHQFTAEGRILQRGEHIDGCLVVQLRVGLVHWLI